MAFVGLRPYRVVSGIKDARVGLQKPLFGGSHAWLLPNPSGLNAHYLPAALALLPGDPAVMVDLQAVLDHCYDAGPYAREVSYQADTPAPPLQPDQEKWAKEVLQRALPGP